MSDFREKWMGEEIKVEIPFSPDALSVVGTFPETKISFPDCSFVFPPGSLQCTGCELVFTWPRWLRWLERRWRQWRGDWEVSYSFKVISEGKCEERKDG
jgi:hypothetical protein